MISYGRFDSKCLGNEERERLVSELASDRSGSIVCMSFLLVSARGCPKPNARPADSESPFPSTF